MTDQMNLFDCCPEVGGPVWRKSSFSGNTGGQCLEVAIHHHDGAPALLVRDSKNAPGPVLAFCTDEWQAFTSAVKAGEFNLPAERIT